MKKQLMLLGLLCILLSGCSQLNGYLENIPFIGNGNNNGSHDNVDPVQNDDKQQSEEEENTETPQQEAIEDDAANDESANQENNLVLEASFFNHIKVVDGKNYIQNPENVMALVNKDYYYVEKYTPADLVRPNVEFSFGDQDIEKSYMREEAAGALEKMFAQAKNEGVNLFAVSGYRSYSRQNDLFKAEVAKVGEELAAQTVAYPGSSEHQSGLAMDISSHSADFLLTEQFAETAEGKWLADHAHLFGFILRYPKGKEDITGYSFEPWHYRYVGIEGAKVIFEKNLTLEEYFNLVKKI
ncbi:M15 family metallopeptidase [Cytobacillus gottheilii]|uniref:M15 family metallopeptidase n=1 Tax=Cytobacillus gottheilii TaxID=859144 RepID=UPI0009B9CC05|nr:M15 family metallopeptidase [Cytobacillus gottheilii]